MPYGYSGAGAPKSPAKAGVGYLEEGTKPKPKPSNPQRRAPPSVWGSNNPLEERPVPAGPAPVVAAAPPRTSGPFDRRIAERAAHWLPSGDTDPDGFRSDIDGDMIPIPTTSIDPSLAPPGDGLPPGGGGIGGGDGGGDPRFAPTNYQRDVYRDFTYQDPGFGSYYDRAFERGSEQINQSLAAQGLLNSSQTAGLTGELAANLGAERANREADHYLQSMGLRGQLAGGADVMQRMIGQDFLDAALGPIPGLSANAAGQYGGAFSADQELMDIITQLALGIRKEGLTGGQQQTNNNAAFAEFLYNEIFG